MQVASSLHRLLYEVVSLLVTALPEHVKEQERVKPYATARMHVLSGAAEFFGATALFIVAMIRFVVGFTNHEGYTAIASMPTTDYGTFFGVGALAYLSFFITPQALFLVFCVAEGLVRAFETALTGRLLGMAVVALPYRCVELVAERSRQARTRVMLGPRRPDEVVLPERSRAGLLEIYSVEDKPWSEVQVVEYLGTFYVLTGKRLVPRGGHHAYRYSLHATEEREVIRGSVVHYGPRSVPAGDLPARAPIPAQAPPEGRIARHGEAEPAFPPPTPELFAAARRQPRTQPEHRPAPSSEGDAKKS